jgi:hypothetical protein
MTPEGSVVWFAGGTLGEANGPALLTTFRSPNNIAMDKHGNFTLLSSLTTGCGKSHGNKKAGLRT